MSRTGGISLDFADGEYCFRLPWGQLIELQELCDAGPYVLLDRLLKRTFRLGEVREVVRLGLIGGGLDAAAALRLVRTYIEDVERHSLLNNAVLAQAILMAALMPPEDEPAGEAGAANPVDGISTVSRTEN